MNSRLLRVRATIPSFVAWLGTILFGVGVVGSLVSGEGGGAPIFLCFGAICVFLIVTTGELSMSEDEVIYESRLGTYKLRWDEIERIEVDSTNTGMIFYSRQKGKRLSVFGPTYWSGPDGESMNALLSAQLQKRGITVRTSMRPQFTAWGGKG